MRMSSSTYAVLSHPVGPTAPRGNVTSTGEPVMVSLHASNLTLILRASAGSGAPPTSTVTNPPVLPSLLNSGVGLFTSKATTLRILFLLKSMDWVLLMLFRLSSPSPSLLPLLTSRPMSSRPSCKFYESYMEDNEKTSNIGKTIIEVK